MYPVPDGFEATYKFIRSINPSSVQGDLYETRWNGLCGVDIMQYPMVLSEGGTETMGVLQNTWVS